MSELKDFLNGGGSLAPQINENTQRTELINNPNLLINGDFNVWQRGEQFTDITFARTADKWVLANGNGVTSVISWNPLVGEWGNLTSGMSISTLANSQSYIYQTIENGYNLTLGKTVTFSADVYVNDVDLLTALHFDFFTQGVVDTGQVEVTSQLVSGDFVRVSGSIEIPTTVTTKREGIPLSFRLFVEALSGASVIITNAKVEIGEVATDFQADDPQVSLAKCQRFYATEVLVAAGGSASGALNAVASFTYPVSMYKQPVITSTNADANNVSPTMQIWSANKTGAAVFHAILSSGAQHYQFLDYVTLEAEL